MKTNSGRWISLLCLCMMPWSALAASSLLPPDTIPPIFAPLHASLIRGPYLNSALTTGITIRWRTDIPTIGKVQYGPAPGHYTHAATDTVFSTDHQVTIAGLAPNTLYYYRIGTPWQILQGDSSNYFKTMPPVGSTGKIRVLAMGDMGNNSPNQANVRDAWLAFNAQQYTDAWLLLGDNAYSQGKDAEYQTNFFNLYQNSLTKNQVLWPAVGNHDYGNSTARQLDHQIPYYDIFTLPANGEAGGIPSGTEAFYAFNYGNVHFVALDSYGWEAGNTRLYDTLGPQATWLKKDLEANNQTWTIVYFHHPPYTKGSHDSDLEGELINMRHRLVPIFERYGVDLVLSGHSHCYERSYLLNGHYEQEMDFDPTTHALSNTSGRYDGSDNSCAYVKDAANPRNGIVYAVVGSAGQVGGVSAGYPHNAMAYSNVTLGGALYLEIENNRLTGQWLGADGQLHDQFTLFKSINRYADLAIEAGTSLMLSASWQGSWMWSTGDTTQTITVSPVGNTLYTVSDSQGCLKETFDVIISNDTIPGTHRPIVRLSPNPVHSMLSIKIRHLDGPAGIRIFDANGREMLRQEATGYENLVDTHPFPPGFYRVVVTDKYGTALGNSRFIKM